MDRADKKFGCHTGNQLPPCGSHVFSLYGSAQKCNHFGQYRRDLFEFRQNRIDNRPAVSGLTLLLFIKDPALRRRRKLLFLHNTCLFDIIAVNRGKIVLHRHGFKSEFFALLVEFGSLFRVAVIAFGIVAKQHIGLAPVARMPASALCRSG